MLDCNSERLLEFLDGNLSNEQQQQVESHLEACTACQSMLESCAATDAFWRTAAETLSQDTPVFPLHSAVLTTHESPRSSTVVSQQLGEWLGTAKSTDGLGKVDHYEVIEIVGQGGMGVVLRAYDTKLRRQVAIKTLLHPSCNDQSLHDRLLREAQVVASLKHQNIIATYSVGRWRSVPFIVMPFVEGGTLSDYARGHRFTLPETMLVIRQVAQALIAAHQIQLVHRDIKPSNILLQQGLEHILLADFGLARIPGDQTITHTGVVPGTPHFMAPEQALDQPVDPRADQFSLGSVAYWMLTGRPPFAAETSFATLVKLTQEAPKPLSGLRPDAPKFLQRLLAKMMAKDPRGRFQDMEAALQAIDEVLDCIVQDRVPTLPSLRSKALWTRRNLAFLGASVCLLLIGLWSWNSFAHFSRKTTGLSSRSTQIENANSGREGLPSSTSSTPTVRFERDGPLDAIEVSNAEEDLLAKRNLKYWLERIEQLDVKQTPSKLVPLVQRLASNEDPSIQQLASGILAKNPFIEVPALSGTTLGVDESKTSKFPDNNPPDNASPFVEVTNHDQ